jgi:hypothetical protein
MENSRGRQSKAQQETGLDDRPYKKYLVRPPEIEYRRSLTWKLEHNIGSCEDIGPWERLRGLELDTYRPYRAGGGVGSGVWIIEQPRDRRV